MKWKKNEVDGRNTISIMLSLHSDHDQQRQKEPLMSQYWREELIPFIILSSTQ